MKSRNTQQIEPYQNTTIYIENLDLGMSEHHLYLKFKEIGEIQSLKIIKDKFTKISTGQAFITFATSVQADKAKKIFNNAVFIKNIIRVKAYFNHQNVDKRANIFINNLPEDVDTIELEQEFSRFGTVLSIDIHREKGKALKYGYVQFDKKEQAENLIQEATTNPLIYKTKTLKLEYFKDKLERNTESTSMYLRAFARPLNDAENGNEKLLRIIEFAWTLIIKNYFLKQNTEVKDCFVKIDQFTRQPWAIIQLNSPDQAKQNLQICEKLRIHPCIESSAAQALELIYKVSPFSDSDDIQQVKSFFEEQAKTDQDIFLGQSDNFFYNQVYSKHLNPDDRLILVQNIRNEVTQEDIEQFLGIFGKVIRLTIRKSQNSRLQVKQCYVHYQTIEDSKRALSEVHDNCNIQLVEVKKKIFNDGHVMMNILVSKAIRKSQKTVKQNRQGKIKVIPNNDK